ncbi:hypothetical protein J7E73_29230 [Paenibacillus albidus]|uniref:hypothetical protein n=1 Tax=Paenibacillus albidus TaxID=2041023 RepID=UPI001BE627C2|nr:hypothetical protein [Paenibacillus albidus]MBT2293125.1 hypothetical protein [Paenibacillus albidus]
MKTETEKTVSWCCPSGLETEELEYPEFDPLQMNRFVARDPYLRMMFQDLQQKGHAAELALEVLFNANVLEDSAMTREYNSYFLPKEDNSNDENNSIGAKISPPKRNECLSSKP